MKEGAVQKLCYTYKSLGNQEKAIYYAGKGGSFDSTREQLLSFAREGEEGMAITQNYLLSLISEAASVAAYDLLGKGDYTAEEKIQIYEFAISLMKLPFSDDDVAFYGNYISKYYSNLARQYASIENAEKTLEALENARKYAVIASEEMEGTYIGLLLDHVRHDPAKSTKNYRGNACDLLLKELKWKIFDFVRGHERFLEVEKELKKNAEYLLFA